jgi:hypothetical protein
MKIEALADQVRWEWFYYGRPQIASNRQVWEFVKSADGIFLAASYAADSKPILSEPAVAIL